MNEPTSQDCLYSLLYVPRERHDETLDLLVRPLLLEIRDHPPEGLQRIPGPKAIRYYLERDPTLQAQGLPLPRSSRTIWRIDCWRSYASVFINSSIRLLMLGLQNAENRSARLDSVALGSRPCIFSRTSVTCSVPN